MFRTTLNIVVLCVTLLQAATGCAAQLKEVKGISRIGYAIQVGAFSEVKNAERLSSKLQQKGIEAFYFRNNRGVYAVRFGDFETRETARKAAQRLVTDKVIGAYFIAPPQQVTRLKTGEKSWEKPPEPSLKKLSPVVPKQKGEQGGDVLPSAGGKGRSDMGAIAARTAERFVGIPYRWGGDTVVDGMDCSGFVRAVYNLCGVNIPRTARDQFKVGEKVAKEELLDGDLVFFGSSGDEINHVGIYVGNGRFVHAPRRGDDIKVSSLEEGYFTKKYIGAKRYF